jgi:AraC-like DNA-binding protein
MSYIFIVCLALISFFSFSLITKKDKTLSERIFVAWIFLLALTELSFFLNSIGLFRDYTLLFAFICDTHVIHGSLFYLYILSFTDKNFTFQTVHLIHILPFIALFSLKLYFNKILGVMDCYGAGCLHHGNQYVDLLLFLKFGILGTYLFMGWHIVHDRVIHNNIKDNLEKIRANWIRNISVGALIIFVFSAGYKILTRLGFPVLGSDITVINLMVSFFILVFLYMGNSYAYIFVSPYQGKGVDLDTTKKTNDLQIPNTNEDINIKDIDRKFSLIEKYLSLEKPFLKGQITIRELSESINIPQNEVSLIIQTKTNKFYTDYMNMFRVDELKQKLDNPANESFTIYSLALECGFASKTSFNRIFKHHTGMTPTEYRNK